jgi:hypothetical protein
LEDSLYNVFYARSGVTSLKVRVLATVTGNDVTISVVQVELASMKAEAFSDQAFFPSSPKLDVSQGTRIETRG